MHDIKFIRDNPKKFDDKMKNRNVKIKVIRKNSRMARFI